MEPGSVRGSCVRSCIGSSLGGYGGKGYLVAIHNGLVNEPILELRGATVVKDGRRVLDRVSLTIGAGEHPAILGPNGAGKSMLVSLLTHAERPLAPANGLAPVRVFGQETWNIFDLRSQLGIVSSALHHHFVNGNSEGSISVEAAVLSAFLNSYGILRY